MTQTYAGGHEDLWTRMLKKTRPLPLQPPPCPPLLSSPAWPPAAPIPNPINLKFPICSYPLLLVCYFQKTFSPWAMHSLSPASVYPQSHLPLRGPSSSLWPKELSETSVPQVFSFSAFQCWPLLSKNPLPPQLVHPSPLLSSASGESHSQSLSPHSDISPLFTPWQSGSVPIFLQTAQSRRSFLYTSY